MARPFFAYHAFSYPALDSIRKFAMGPGRNFIVVRNEPSTSNTLARALTGFKRFPGFRDPALNPNHELLESPDPAIISLCRVFPDGN
jgi:hypothetical protein